MSLFQDEEWFRPLTGEIYHVASSMMYSLCGHQLDGDGLTYVGFIKESDDTLNKESRRCKTCSRIIEKRKR